MPSKNRSKIKTYVLSTDASTVLIACYARHGVGRYRSPHQGSAIDAILINAEREVRVEPATVEGSWGIRVGDYRPDSGWRLLGWRFRDGSQPYGPHDAVDPAMAVFDDLPRLNVECAESGPMRPYHA